MLGPIPYRPWACPVLFLRCHDAIRSAPFRPRTASVGILIGGGGIPRGGTTLPELPSRLEHGTHTAALRYQHVTAERHREVADRLGSDANRCCRHKSRQRRLRDHASLNLAIQLRQLRETARTYGRAFLLVKQSVGGGTLSTPAWETCWAA
jgi:hypothetical protein